MNIEVIYIYPVNEGPQYQELARRFVSTYRDFPPGVYHHTLIVLNGNPRSDCFDIFSSLPNLRFFLHDNSGWDIGAFQAVADSTKCDMMVCFGSASYFHKPGWLLRFVLAWSEFGPGLYANMSCGPGRAHPTINPVRTVGFACPPALIRAYPKRVVSRRDRYDFEHRSPNNLTALCLRMKMPVKFVTWDGFYDISEYCNRVNNLII